MRILLTGGTGLLGRAVLRIAGDELFVRSLVRQNSQIADLQQYSNNGNTREYVIGDMESVDSLSRACEGIDVVVHSAALSSPWGKRADFERVNVEGTQNLLQAAKDAGVKRFVFISSSSVYFDFSDGKNILESQSLPASYCNDYAASKAMAESRVLDSEISSAVLRPRGIFGPHDRAIVPRLLAAVRGSQLVLPSARNPVVDLTYVDNVANAVLQAVDSTATGVFNISNAQPMPLLTMLRMLLDELKPSVTIKTLPYKLMTVFAALDEQRCKLLPSFPEPRLTRYSAGLFHYHQHLDISAAREQLGYSPEISIEEGIRRYASWYRQANESQTI